LKNGVFLRAEPAKTRTTEEKFSKCPGGYYELEIGIRKKSSRFSMLSILACNTWKNQWSIFHVLSIISK